MELSGWTVVLVLLALVMIVAYILLRKKGTTMETKGKIVEFPKKLKVDSHETTKDEVDEPGPAKNTKVATIHTETTHDESKPEKKVDKTETTVETKHGPVYAFPGYTIALPVIGALVVVLLLTGLFWSSGPQATDTAKTGSVPTSWAANCPNFSPKRLALTEKWVNINPDHPDENCDFVYKIVSGNIVKSGPDGTEIPDPQKTGTVSSKVIHEVRAFGDRAVIYYTLCPLGHAPSDDSAVCRS